MPTDLNRVRGADPNMWLGRNEATALRGIPYEGKTAPPQKQDRVNMTTSMRTLLINLRKRAGVTSEEAAKAAGHTQSWMSHVEGGYTRSITEQDFDTLLMYYNEIIGGKAAG